MAFRLLIFIFLFKVLLFSQTAENMLLSLNSANPVSIDDETCRVNKLIIPQSNILAIQTMIENTISCDDFERQIQIGCNRKCKLTDNQNRHVLRALKELNRISGGEARIILTSISRHIQRIYESHRTISEAYFNQSIPGFHKLLEMRYIYSFKFRT
jgi:hypothetical protein